MASTEASMENSKGIVPKFVPNCVFLSSWVSQNPFLIRPFKPITLPSPNCALRELHTSLASTADKCFKILHLAYSNSNYLSNHNFAAVLPGDSVAGIVVANGILNFLNIYNTLLIVRLVLTWFPNSPPAIVSPLSTLCDPYLNIFRGIIPPLGGTLDLSPILAFLVLNAFTSTAAALPAELPGKGASTLHTRFTTSQQKWMRRLYGNKPPESSPHAN
ncbi:conserved hypothetical protein [Ricinus communis]|uniref:YGGT family protein n=1 Tax=Ricinus communis TaxID=3988 RepID=B9RQX3_RICCO|nr:conserved hypothetical protein [Ricinus communis]